jgi:hypothetical protein
MAHQAARQAAARLRGPINRAAGPLRPVGTHPDHGAHRQSRGGRVAGRHGAPVRVRCAARRCPSLRGPAAPARPLVVASDRDGSRPRPAAHRPSCSDRAFAGRVCRHPGRRAPGEPTMPRQGAARAAQHAGHPDPVAAPARGRTLDPRAARPGHPGAGDASPTSSTTHPRSPTGAARCPGEARTPMLRSIGPRRRVVVSH